MQDLKPVVSIMLDTRKANKDKLFPIKLRATFQKGKGKDKKWVQRYYPLKQYVSKADWKVINGGNPRSIIQQRAKKVLVEALARANKILENHTIVTLEIFHRLYTGASNLEDVGGIFDIRIADLQRQGRIGSRDIYRAVKNSIQKFSPGVTFFEINSEWLRRYELWLRSHHEGDKVVKISGTTIGIYLRHLRAIFNLAIDMKLVNRDLYPFGHGGYIIKKTQARKISLSEDDKNRLLMITDPDLRYAVDFWMLSYYCFGLNMADIALMKVRDLKDDLLIIGREKKKNTDTSGKMMVIPIRVEVKEIIARWGNKTLNPDDYVFPVLTTGLSPEQMKDRTKDFTKSVNAGLKRVAEKLNLNIKLTTYTARHTFATMALRGGASIELIQDMLGHGSKTTTQNYLSGFDVEPKKAVSAKL
jgi:integrase/recombinase XerD